MNKPFTLSPAIQAHLKPSPTLYINERVQAMWANGEQVFHMGFGESRFPVHPKIQAALSANAHQKSYLAGQGLHPLREAVAQFYGRRLDTGVTAGQVMIGPGSKALMFAIQLALEAALILPTPSWVSYAPQARLLGRPIYAVPAAPESDYAFTLDALDETVRHIQADTRLLVLNSPNNPTGQMLTAEFLENLAAYCRRHNIVVMYDEIYALVPHGLQPHVSLAQAYPEGTLVLSGLSKHLSLGGWRLGTAILPDHEAGQQLMRALVSIASEIWSSPTSPVQYAAVLAYSDDPEINAYVEECRRIHAIRTQHVWSWLNELGIRCAQPAGGFYMFPNFDRWRAPLARRNVHTADDLAAHLLDEYQIATLPGTAFGAPPQDLSLRLATSYLDMETDAQAEAILAAYRANPDADTLMDAHHPATAEALRRFGQFIKRLS